MKPFPTFKLTFSSVFQILLIGFIVYQVSFTWIPLWQKATALKGKDVSKLQIIDENGKAIFLSDFKGNPLIINFWASWCVPCRLEIPLLNAIYPSLSNKNKQLIGVNSSEPQEKIDRYKTQNVITFPVYREAGQLSKQLEIEIIPAIVVIDKDSKVQSITFGFRPWVQAYLLWWV